MQAAGDQLTNQLKLKFSQIDQDHDGFINQAQLEAFMKKEKLYKVNNWQISQAMDALDKKMDEEDFILWISGCKLGLQQFAQKKFKWSSKLKTLSSAGPAANQDLKRSYLNVLVNHQNDSELSLLPHYFNVKLGIDRQEDIKKRQQISQVLGRNPAEVYFVLKFRAFEEGQKVAQKLNELVQMGVMLASELGPNETSFLQTVQITSKWVNNYIYLIFELNNTFVNSLLKFLNQAIQQLTPEGKFLFETRLCSNFSQVLQSSFDPLNQEVSLNAVLEIGGIAMTKLKEKLIEDFGNQKKFRQSTVYLFLLEEVNLALSFCNLKQCFESLGISQQTIPKPGVMAGQLKQYDIKQIISQFLPESDQLLSILSNCCKAEGQLSLNALCLTAEISFNFSIQGAFDLI